MKKYPLVAVCLLGMLYCFASCANNNNESAEVDDEMGFLEYKDIPWNDPIGDFTDRLEISEGTAQKIAELVLLDTGHNSLANLASSVAFLEDEKIFVVSYYPKEIMAGGDINVAIKATTGEILKMWSGE
jgi:hypothetical protein